MLSFGDERVYETPKLMAGAGFRTQQRRREAAVCVDITGSPKRVLLNAAFNLQLSSSSSEPGLAASLLPEHQTGGQHTMEGARRRGCPGSTA